MTTLKLHCGLVATAFLVLIAWMMPAVAQESYAIAGLAPQARPAGAPVVASFEKASDWHENALSGVGKPHPPGLGFLASQGVWYTPFIHPGMPGPYDLRGWHVRGQAGAKARQDGQQ